MDDINQNLETENLGLIARVTEIEAENQNLNIEVAALRKSLEKQKNLYRKFSVDVEESERVRNQAFKSEKRSLLEENKSLVKKNRQLELDVSFYKKTYEELVREDGSALTNHPNQRSPNVNEAFATGEERVHVKRLTRRQATSTQESTSASVSECNRSPQVTPQAECKHKSSRALSKVNEKLFIENKKQKLKIDSLSATNLFLKTKNRQLENYKSKMINKKLKFSQEVDELDRLVASTNIYNKDVYTPEILAKLDELSK